MSRPTLFLSNWASHRSAGHHGPGRALTIMCRPRAWEHGEGRVSALTPDRVDFDAYCCAEIRELEYFQLCRVKFARAQLEPGQLACRQRQDAGLVSSLLRDGDTLCCTCARGAPCHRQIAAALLYGHGWGVVLDGKEYPT